MVFKQGGGSKRDILFLKNWESYLEVEKWVKDFCVRERETAKPTTSTFDIELQRWQEKATARKKSTELYYILKDKQRGRGEKKQNCNWHVWPCVERCVTTEATTNRQAKFPNKNNKQKIEAGNKQAFDHWSSIVFRQG